jgi:hypothetical protein
VDSFFFAIWATSGFEFFGQGLSSLMKDRKSTKSIEQAIKDTESMVVGLDSLDNVQSCIQKASEGMQFHQVEVAFYSTNGRLGSNFDIKNPTICKGRQVGGSSAKWIFF